VTLQVFHVVFEADALRPLRVFRSLEVVCRRVMSSYQRLETASETRRALLEKCKRIFITTISREREERDVEEKTF